MSQTDFIARGADHPPLREDTIGQALDEAALGHDAAAADAVRTSQVEWIGGAMSLNAA